MLNAGPEENAQVGLSLYGPRRAIRVTNRDAD